MDGRVLLLGEFLLFLAMGCQQTVVGVSSSGPQTPVHIDPTQIKKAKEKDPPAAVLASLGDFKAGEAMAPDLTADHQQYLRDLARQDYDKAIKLDRKCVAAYQGLARLYAAGEDYEHAIETYQQALRIAPQNASLWYEMGMSHNYRKNWGPAVECLSRAAQFDPGNRSYLNAKAVVLAQAGRLDESLNCFVRSNGEAMGYYRLAQTLQRLQQPELSRRYLAVAMQKDPRLTPTLALRQGERSNANLSAPAVQQTAYLPPREPAPQAPAAPPEVSTPANQPAAQPFIPPPPPAINVDDEQPR